VGDCDRLTPPVHARRLAQEMPWADFTEIRGAGHMLPLERDRAVTRAIADLVNAATGGTEHTDATEPSVACQAGGARSVTG
jgi:hypothetical protein